MLVRAIALCFLLIMSMAGCATVPRPNPQAEAKIMEANTVLDALNGEVSKFYKDMQEVQWNIQTLYQEPGWSDMQEMIRSIPSLLESTDPFAEIAKLPASSEWSRKWERPWEGLFTVYLALVDRCTALDVRRTALKSDITATQAKYIRISIMELTASRYGPGKSAYDTVDLLGKWVDELDSYSLNDIGLFTVNAS